MQLSIVTTLYGSASHVKSFYDRTSAVASRVTPEYEIIFVNDGSPDRSLEVALTLHAADDRVRIIDLSRNFGHHKAMMTGLAHARGDLVFLIDCDLEEEPELLEAFYNEFNRSGADVVYGVQRSRKGSVLERASAAMFYAVFNLFSNYPIPANLVTARLMRRCYVEALVQHRDREVFLAGLWAITGFTQVPLSIVKHSKGTSTYDLGKKMAVLVNSITSFSNRPLVHIFYLGCLISLAAGAAAVYLVIRRLFFGVLLSGWPSLIVSVWLLGGLTMFSLGVIGIYLSKVFMEVKERPYTVIKKIYGKSGHHDT